MVESSICCRWILLLHRVHNTSLMASRDCRNNNKCNSDTYCVVFSIRLTHRICHLAPRLCLRGNWTKRKHILPGAQRSKTCNGLDQRYLRPSPNPTLSLNHQHSHEQVADRFHQAKCCLLFIILSVACLLDLGPGSSPPKTVNLAPDDVPRTTGARCT